MCLRPSAFINTHSNKRGLVEVALLIEGLKWLNKTEINSLHTVTAQTADPQSGFCLNVSL